MNVCTYLNFPGTAADAVSFYCSVFDTKPQGEIQYFSALNNPEIPAHVNKMVLHAALTIFETHTLMFTDAPEELGHQLILGNHVSISLHIDSKEEADRLFNLLAINGSVQMPLQDTFWGAYHGQCTDQFGIQWMINHE